MGIIWRIIRIGFPASISGIQRNLNQFFLQIFMAPFGAAVLAAHVITQRLEMLILIPAMSFGQGAVPGVSHRFFYLHSGMLGVALKNVV